MSNYAPNWRRTSLIFVAISIAILIPHQLDAKILESSDWGEIEIRNIGLKLDTILINIWEFLLSTYYIVESNFNIKKIGVIVGTVLIIFGGGMTSLEFVMRPGYHNETGKTNIKLPGVSISYVGAASFGMVVAGIIAIILSLNIKDV
jgi:hypothetical protein